MSGLQNSYGPEVTPYQASPEQQSPEPVPYSYPTKNGAPQGPLTKEEQAPEVAVEHPHPRRRKILGLPRVAFYSLLALAIVVVLAIGIGLGVGLTVSGNDSSDSKSDTDNAAEESSTSISSSPAPTSIPPSPTTSPSSPTKSSESTSPSSTATGVTSGTHGIATNSCNFKQPKTYDSDEGDDFTQYCFVDWPKGQPKASGKGNVNDLKEVIAYTFEECMDACADYNDELKKRADSDTPCVAVTYNANLTLSLEVKQHDGNCFLKDSKGKDQPGNDLVASAELSS